MSDEEEVYTDSEEEAQPETPKPREGGDPEFVKRQEAKSSVFDEQLKDYIVEWRKQRNKEEDDLKRLKEKQAKRKVMRAEEEKRLAERKKQEEERRQREAEERRQKEIEEKRQRLEEAEKKRQAMMAALKDSQNKAKGRNFIITKKDSGEPLSSAQIERNKTKEQIEEEKRISLSFRIKPLNIEGFSLQKLQAKARDLWDCIVKLETEKYDLEERQRRQDYDLKELKERQKQQLRHKALKKGLDPEALTGKYPPKIQVASKYERRVDTRSYGDKKKLFEGGHEEAIKETSEKTWSERIGQFENRPKSKLPKWFGERPGKKKDDPETPEEEEVKKADDDLDLEQPSLRRNAYEDEEEEEVEEEEEEYEEEEEESEEEEEEE